MESGRDSYLHLFRYYHTLKNMKFSQILNYFLFKRRREKLSIIDNKRVSIISESLKENIKLEENEENIELSSSKAEELNTQRPKESNCSC